MTKDELGGSEFSQLLARQQGTPAAYGGQVPTLDIPGALALYRAMNRATSRGILRSSHTPTLGGLGVAFVLPAIGGNLGAEIDLSLVPCEGKLGDDSRLFSESNSRFVVTCAPEDTAEVEEIFQLLPCARVGQVMQAPRIRIAGEGGRRLLDMDIDALRRAFKETLYGI